MQPNCKNKPASYPSFAIFDIKRPDGLFMLPKGKAETCAEMINMITKINLHGTYKEAMLSGKHRILFYLDDAVDGDKIERMYGLKWTKHGIRWTSLLSAGTVGIVGGAFVGTALGYNKASRTITNCTDGEVRKIEKEKKSEVFNKYVPRLYVERYIDYIDSDTLYIRLPKLFLNEFGKLNTDIKYMHNTKDLKDYMLYEIRETAIKVIASLAIIQITGTDVQEEGKHFDFSRYYTLIEKWSELQEYQKRIKKMVGETLNWSFETWPEYSIDKRNNIHSDIYTNIETFFTSN